MEKERIVSIEELIALGLGEKDGCRDRAMTEEGAVVYGIGNSYVPDHKIEIFLSQQLIKQLNCKQIAVQIHIIWLYRNDSVSYSGLVADKTDTKLYFASVTPGDCDSSGYYRFLVATPEVIQGYANKYNPYLAEVVNIAQTDRKQLLEYQIYSNLSDRFCYMEIPMEDRVAMCGVGLHSNKLAKVGLVGKFLCSDFWIAYAECTFDAYDELKRQNPILYNRGRLMEKNRQFFSYYKTLFDQRRKHKKLVDIVLHGNDKTIGTRNVTMFSASPHGTVMREYIGPAHGWMEAFVTECKKHLER